MRSLAILLLATAVLAAVAPTKNDQKNKRHLPLSNLGVSSYNLPYNFAGYPIELFGTRLSGVPLGNNLVLVCPPGLEYGDLLYRGNIIGSDELAFTFAQPSGFVSDVSALPLIVKIVEQSKIKPTTDDEVPITQTTPPTTAPPTDDFNITAIELTDETAVSGGIASLLNNFRLFIYNNGQSS